MPRRHLALRVRDDEPGQELRLGFARIREEMGLPGSFPDDVQAEAEAAALDVDLSAYDRDDLTELPFLSIDPPGSTDLDQAMHLERRGRGYRVRYAIADVGAFVRPGGRVDAEAHRRGETLYSPDTRTPLHPPVLSEGAASLMPDQVRPALLWTMDLDAEGEQTAVEVRRALVRSRDRLDYAGVQGLIDAGRADERIQLLAEVGKLRMALEVERGGVSLPIPEQEVAEDGGTFRLEYRVTLPVESWNEQISLMTGMAAADLMLHGEVGVLRTLRPLPTAPSSSCAGPRVPCRSSGRGTPRMPRSSTAWTPRTHGTPPCSRTPRHCCGEPATRRSTTASRSRPPMPRWRRSTPTRPLRCGGSSTGTSGRSASPCAPGPTSRTGCGQRFRDSRPRWPRPIAGRTSSSASASP